MSYVQNAWVTSGSAVPGSDWYAALRPIMCFSRIIGLFPLSLRGPVGRRKFSANWALLIYSVVVCILLTTSSVVLQPLELFNRMGMGGLMIKFMICTYSLSMIVVFATGICTNQKMATVMNNMCAQDEALAKVGIRFDYAANFKRSCIRLVVVLSAIVILEICDFVTHFITMNLSMLMVWMTWTSFRFVRIISACLFTEMILVLRQKFTAINENLEEMIDKTKESPLQTVFMRFKMCERIRSLVRIHGDMSESTSSLNQIFGINIVMGIILAFLALISTSFYIITEIKNYDINVSDIISSIIRTLLTSADSFYMLWACIVAQEQANLTAKLIHNFNSRDFDSQSATKITIQSCSLQLHYAKIKFTGAGLFPLDATLIRSIVGAATTYLIVMLQFDTAKP